MEILTEILKAERRIRPHCLVTPLIKSKPLSKLNQGEVYLKLESEQYTGSFKARGSMNKIKALTEMERSRGVITASTGNHALGFARALEITGLQGTIFLPENASKSKVAALRDYPVELVFYGNNSLETELYAKNKAQEKGAIWVSPYNDPQIIGGQGTLGIELMQQLPSIDHVLVTVGGGGLISGIATYLDGVSPATKIVGCLPQNSPEMYLSVQAGKVVELPEFVETLSDGSAGGLEPGSITFPVCQQLVDEFILVSEEEIKEGIRFMAHAHHKIIEGAAGVAVAGFVKNASNYQNETVVIIVCGANIDIEKLKAIL